MKKLGIFYICTGPYKVFWNDFFDTAEKYFLSDIEKHYFIFTDEFIEGRGNFEKLNTRCNMHFVQNMPWPLITLLRFHFFISIEDELDKMDYLMFSNSNMRFETEITIDDFLPRTENNEEIFVTAHPAYFECKPYKCPFERNRKSLAYIPYNIKTPYVIGAMNGGTKDGFLKMAHDCAKNIESDLKMNLIARWHDESHLNKYIALHKNYRLLSPSYCYPYGFDIDFPKKISTVGKQDKFDVKNFKENDNVKNICTKVKAYFDAKVKPVPGFIRDSIVNKKLK